MSYKMYTIDEIMLEVCNLHDEMRYFLLLDGAAKKGVIPAIIYQLEQNPHLEALFLDTSYENLLLDGPILVQVSKNSPLLAWFWSNFPNKSGLFFYADKSVKLKDFAAHLRPYVEVIFPSDKKMLFRFYDPAIFKCFWPSLTLGERSLFLGQSRGVIYCESDENNTNCWQHQINSSSIEFKVGANKRPWILSDESYLAMQLPCRHSLSKQMANNFTDFYPQRARTLKEEHLSAFSKLLVEKGFEIGYRSEKELNSLMICMAQLGSFFDSDPQYPWAVLEKNQRENALQRLHIVGNKIVEFQKVVWGDFGRPYQRALYTIWNSLKPEVMDKIKNRKDALYIVGILYREKARFQGQDSLEKLFDLAAHKGLKYNISSMKGLTIITAIFFFFGSGADNDPLYPWVGSILRKNEPEAEKIEELFKMARKRARAEYIIQRKLNHIPMYEQTANFLLFLSNSSIEELQVPLQELNQRFKLQLKEAELENCLVKSTQSFPSPNQASTRQLYALALLFSQRYPSPENSKLNTIVAGNNKKSFSVLSNEIETWLRLNSGKMGGLIKDNIIFLPE